jgi:hypothetical protein
MARLPYIFSYGQSIAVGTAAQNASSTTQTRGNLMLPVRSFKAGTTSGILARMDGLIDTATLVGPFVPLVSSNVTSDTGALDGSYHYTGSPANTDGAYGETSGPAMLNAISDAIPGWFGVYQAAGRGGAEILQRMKGGDVYENAMRLFRAANDRAIVDGYAGVEVQVILEESGESDFNSTLFAGRLQTLLMDFTADIKAYNGQTFSPRMFVPQISFESSRISALQQQLATTQSSLIHLVTPTYILAHSGNHPTAPGHVLFGQYSAKTYVDVIANGGTHIGLRVTSATLTGKTIDITMNVPTIPVARDVSGAWGTITNSGFEYVDDTTSAAIATVQVNPTGARIVLDVVPVGANPRLKYAVAQSYGNVRDGAALPNWLQHADVAITPMATPGSGAFGPRRR